MNKESFIYSGIELDSLSYAKNYNDWIIEPFLPFLKGRVVEVGAGKGTLTPFLSKHSDQYLAIEPDKDNFVSLGKTCNRLGLDCFNGFLSETSLTSNSINTFIYVNVLEHVYDDFAELSLAKEKLTRNGIICVFVPALPFLYGEMDKQVGHYRRYTKSRLITLIDKVGMKVESIRYVDSVGILPWYVSTCLCKNCSVSPRGVRLYDTLVVPWLRRVEGIIPPFIGKNLMLIARTI